MRLFGVSLVTLVMILAVGYLVGVMYPALGNSTLTKIGLK